MKKEITALLSEWLKQDPEEAEDNKTTVNTLSSSGGGCNEGISLFALGFVFVLLKRR